MLLLAPQRSQVPQDLQEALLCTLCLTRMFIALFAFGT